MIYLICNHDNKVIYCNCSDAFKDTNVTTDSDDPFDNSSQFVLPLPPGLTKLAELPSIPLFRPARDVLDKLANHNNLVVPELPSTSPSHSSSAVAVTTVSSDTVMTQPVLKPRKPPGPPPPSAFKTKPQAITST
jgi:hypothetical protein